MPTAVGALNLGRSFLTGSEAPTGTKLARPSQQHKTRPVLPFSLVSCPRCGFGFQHHSERPPPPPPLPAKATPAKFTIANIDKATNDHHQREYQSLSIHTLSRHSGRSAPALTRQRMLVRAARMPGAPKAASTSANTSPAMIKKLINKNKNPVGRQTTSRSRTDSTKRLQKERRTCIAFCDKIKLSRRSRKRCIYCPPQSVTRTKIHVYLQQQQQKLPLLLFVRPPVITTVVL